MVHKQKEKDTNFPPASQISTSNKMVLQYNPSNKEQSDFGRRNQIERTFVDRLVSAD